MKALESMSANEHRNYQIFEEFAYIQIAEARKVCLDALEFDLLMTNEVYAVDSTTIDLCLSVFWWAKFRKHKVAIKLHPQFDIKTEIPSYIHFTDGATHDVNILDHISI